MTEYHCDSEHTAQIIEHKVKMYCHTHAGEGICALDDLSPIVKALSTEMKNYLAFEFGGIGAYWAMMCCAAQHWFSPGDVSYEFRVFKGMLNCTSGLVADAQSGESALFSHIYHQFQQWQRASTLSINTHKDA